MQHSLRLACHLMITGLSLGTPHAYSDPFPRHSQSRTTIRSRAMPLLRCSTVHDQPALRALPTHHWKFQGRLKDR